MVVHMFFEIVFNRGFTCVLPSVGIRLVPLCIGHYNYCIVSNRNDEQTHRHTEIYYNIIYIYIYLFIVCLLLSSTLGSAWIRFGYASDFKNSKKSVSPYVSGFRFRFPPYGPLFGRSVLLQYL